VRGSLLRPEKRRENEDEGGWKGGREERRGEEGLVGWDGEGKRKRGRGVREKRKRDEPTIPQALVEGILKASRSHSQPHSQPSLPSPPPPPKKNSESVKWNESKSENEREREERENNDSPSKKDQISTIPPSRLNSQTFLDVVLLRSTWWNGAERDVVVGRVEAGGERVAARVRKRKHGRGVQSAWKEGKGKEGGYEQAARYV